MKMRMWKRKEEEECQPACGRIALTCWFDDDEDDVVFSLRHWSQETFPFSTTLLLVPAKVTNSEHSSSNMYYLIEGR